MRSAVAARRNAWHNARRDQIPAWRLPSWPQWRRSAPASQSVDRVPMLMVRAPAIAAKFASFLAGMDHRRRRAGCQQNVGCDVHGNEIGDAMDERRSLTHRGEPSSSCDRGVHNAPFQAGPARGAKARWVPKPEATPSASMIWFRFKGYISARLATDAPVCSGFRRERGSCHQLSVIATRTQADQLQKIRRSLAGLNRAEDRDKHKDCEPRRSQRCKQAL